MTDPRLIALSSNPGQVEPGPFSEHDLREQWNAQADEFNQWESLDLSEQLAWAQTRAVDKHAPDADQAEGPSLADIAELCEEFGFTLDPTGGTVAVLAEMITAAITRWRAPVTQPAAQPVDWANLMRLTEGGDPLAPGDPDVDHILALAAIIRKVDGKHELGAAALAEAILAHPGFSGCHDGPAASAVSPVEPSPVAISEAQNIGEDELYTNWYCCPNCKDDMITRRSNFCPKCGVKLQWEGGATNA